jgi:hypothetical protein
MYHNHYPARQTSQGDKAVFPIIIALIGDGYGVTGQDLPGIFK